MRRFQEMVLIFFMCLIVGSCIKAPTIAWYLWDTNTLQFEGAAVNGITSNIPGNSLQSNHMVCTDPSGFDALVTYMNSKCN